MLPSQPDHWKYPATPPDGFVSLGSKSLSLSALASDPLAPSKVNFSLESCQFRILITSSALSTEIFAFCATSCAVKRVLFPVVESDEPPAEITPITLKIIKRSTNRIGKRLPTNKLNRLAAFLPIKFQPFSSF